jgi:uncharacterized protein (TIGR02452 family)
MDDDDDDREPWQDANALVGRETLAIVNLGSYVAPSNRTIDIEQPCARAVERTFLLRQDELRARLAGKQTGAPVKRTVEVTGERSGEAARRLAATGARVGILNFANGVTPGGGFLGGARAQEEQLCRCSSLYPCLIRDDDARAYYAENAAADTALVLDHVLVSPGVVFFRDEDFTLLEAPFTATVLTCAAPDQTWLFARTDSGLEPLQHTLEVPELFARRTKVILEAAVEARVEALVLGAWGCGAFGNDPEVVASAFSDALALYADAFPRVVFAVFGGAPENRAAFQRRFG